MKLLKFVFVLLMIFIACLQISIGYKRFKSQGNLRDYQIDIKDSVYMLYDNQRLVKVWMAADIPQLDSIVNEDNQ